MKSSQKLLVIKMYQWYHFIAKKVLVSHGMHISKYYAAYDVPPDSTFHGFKEFKESHL